MYQINNRFLMNSKNPTYKILIWKITNLIIHTKIIIIQFKKFQTNMNKITSTSKNKTNQGCKIARIKSY
jgi:hypothetical protein